METIAIRGLIQGGVLLIYGRPKIVLGTAQFGMDYGIDGKLRVERHVASAIVDHAIELGIEWIDTAPAYGDAEEVLARPLKTHRRLRVITKIPALATLATEKRPSAKSILETLHSSLRSLGRDSVEVVLVHNAEDLRGPFADVLAEALERARTSGLCAQVGVSGYDWVDVQEARLSFQPQVAQLPSSIYDQRLGPEQFVDALSSGIDLHVRSVYLQGILLTPPDSLPQTFAKLVEHQREFHEECARRGVSPQQACLAHLSSLKGVTHIVVGVNSKTELSEAASAVADPSQHGEWQSYAVEDLGIIDPRRW